MSLMAKRMKERCDAYWSKYSSVFERTAVLDPRFKLTLVRFVYGKMLGNDAGEEKSNEARANITRLYQDLVGGASNGAQASTPADDDCMEEWHKHHKNSQERRSWIGTWI